MTEPGVLWVVALCAAVVVLTALSLKFVEWTRRRRHRRAGDHGRAMEAAAPERLEAHGYTVLATNPRFSFEWWLGGEPTEGVVEPDLLVRRAGRTYVVEVKTGNAARIRAGQRRQIFEYAARVPADGLLFYDADADTLLEVEFPAPDPSSPLAPSRTLSSWTLVLTGLCLGVLIGATAAALAL